MACGAVKLGGKRHHTAYWRTLPICAARYARRSRRRARYARSSPSGERATRALRGGCRAVGSVSGRAALLSGVRLASRFDPDNSKQGVEESNPNMHTLKYMRLKISLNPRSAVRLRPFKAPQKLFELHRKNKRRKLCQNEFANPNPNSAPLAWHMMSDRRTCVLGPLDLCPGTAEPVSWDRCGPVSWDRSTCVLGPLWTCVLGPLDLCPGTAVPQHCLDTARHRPTPSTPRHTRAQKDVLVSIFWHGPLCLSGVLSVFFRGQLRVGAVRWAGAS